MRHTNEKHCVFPRLGRGVVYGMPRVLFEQVINVLQARDVALTTAVYSLVKPADRRTERNSIVPNFSFRF